ncbi:MAG TPA: ABC transporter ATP-binding protein, partial [Longimicrobiales bacterium]|nr:ABC transporter ATP-binding protein [Longimicrobiales bacterium]
RRSRRGARRGWTRRRRSAMAEHLLRVERVAKTYGGRVPTRVLFDIDLEVRAAEFVALTGPSGSGKSTLLNLIGLLDRPTDGEIDLAGRGTTQLDDQERTRLRARQLGFIFQFHHLLPAFTATENVEMPLLADRGRRDAEMRQRAIDLLEDVGLSHRLTFAASDLSGGEQQRVAVARALVSSPLLVLADEPTGNLDTENGEQVLRLLRRFNETEGTAFLVVTHDQAIAEQCDRVVHLVDGRIVSDRRT